jgi:hypothetical protein
LRWKPILSNRSWYESTEVGQVQQEATYGFETLAGVIWSARQCTLVVKGAVGQTTKYAYKTAQGNHLMVRVGWPGAGNAGRLYHYEDQRFPNLLTGVSQQGGDGVVQRLSGYDYDAEGHAVGSTSFFGEPVRIEARTSPRPNLPGRSGRHGHTVLVDGAGQETTYTHAVIGGENRLLEARGSGCRSCGLSNVRYRYDERGLLQEVTRVDAEGRPVAGLRKTFDAWGRTLRVEQLDYSAQGKPALLSSLRLLVRY